MSEFSQKFMKWCGENSSRFIETGTFKGETTKLASKHFKNVTTIEINEDNYNYSKNRLNNISSIEFLLGDTIKLFPSVIENHNDLKSTFWLDAHPMDPEKDGDCPLLVELDILKKHSKRNDHIIIIDDLQRCYNSKGNYPKFEELEGKLLAINPNYIIKPIPFKSWGVKKGDPSVLVATTVDFNFNDDFYLNKWSWVKKQIRRFSN